MKWAVMTAYKGRSSVSVTATSNYDAFWNFYECLTL